MFFCLIRRSINGEKGCRKGFASRQKNDEGNDLINTYALLYSLFRSRAERSLALEYIIDGKIQKWDAE